MSVLPPDPLDDSAQACIAYHEAYKNLRAGGFSMVTACVVVASMIVLNGSRGPEDV